MILGTLLLGSNLQAGLLFSDAEVLSAGGSVTGDGLAFKTKLVRLGDGTLISVYGDANGPDVYDVKDDNVRPARDIYVRTCKAEEANGYCASQSDWSDPVNISNTAGQTSISTKWQDTNNNGIMDDAAVPFYGDSDKPNIFSSGSFAVVTWTDKYCPGGDQRSASYLERGGIQVPFSCVYESHINFKDATPTWSTARLTSAERDAKQDVSKGLSVGTPALGKWVITWQEDPHGLQLGEAEGPGDGASGAKVTNGTDIWYSYTEDLMNGSFSTPVRLTDNMTGTGGGGNSNNMTGTGGGENTNPVYDNVGNPITTLDKGTTGASRANLALVGPEGIAIVTYEETKGSSGLDKGKFVRYHAFPFNTPDTNATGAIISDPTKNARRVRVIPQSKAGANGLRMGIIWREGAATEGGPADIMARLGFVDSNDSNSTGLRFKDMIPNVDPNAEAIDYDASTQINNAHAYNMSSNTIPWSLIGGPELAPTNTLSDTTEKNPYENARAHRAVIRGDDFHVGYTYTKDWAVAEDSDLDNYNFWVRSYNAINDSWTTAKNLSNITDKRFNVKEPRLVGMPGNGPGCKDTANPTDPEDCQNMSVLLAAWGVESTVYYQISGSVDGDIIYTRTKDKGLTYLEPSVVEGRGINNRAESQLRSTPAGNIIFSVWNEKNNEVGGDYAMFSVSTAEGPTEPVILDPVTPEPITPEPITPEPSKPGGGGGCTYNPNQKGLDMMFLIMASFGFLYLLRRKTGN